MIAGFLVVEDEVLVGRAGCSFTQSLEIRICIVFGTSVLQLDDLSNCVSDLVFDDSEKDEQITLLFQEVD